MSDFTRDLRRNAATLVRRLSTLSTFAIFVLASSAQTAREVISLVRAPTSEQAAKAQAHSVSPTAGTSDYTTFGSATVGESAPAHTLTFQFQATTRITTMGTSGDFKLSGGSCTEGHSYLAGDRCSVDLIFHPQGPGHRTGKFSIRHSASAKPMIVPTGGEGYGPAVSFIPATITTLPVTGNETYGVLSTPAGLAVDGGDVLYISDSGNNLVRYIDSSGTMTTLAGGGTNTGLDYVGPATSATLNLPWGIGIDFAGGVYFSDQGNVGVRFVDAVGEIHPNIGGGADGGSCTLSHPCAPTSIQINEPYGLAVDPAGSIFIQMLTSEGSSGAMGRLDVWGQDPGFSYFNSYYDLFSNSTALAVDPYDDVYFGFTRTAQEGLPADCHIYGQNPAYGQKAAGGITWNIAGSKSCGFSGDGGLAAGAEIGSVQPGIALDTAGDLYFSDFSNNRVRRVDALTGIIRTVAGDGGAGVDGDLGPATAAQTGSPFGVAVDSQGNVYVTGGTASGSVIRKIGGAGQIAFQPQVTGTASPTQTVLVTNSGNGPLDFSSIAPTAGDLADFTLDTHTTTCSVATALQSGQSCLIGAVFKPTASGNRFAVVTLSDNSATGNHVVQLTGLAGTVAAATLSPASIGFGSETTGIASAYKYVTLSNTGVQPLLISSITVSGAGFAPGITTCGTSLAANSSCVYSAHFKPLATGSAAGSMVFATSAGSHTVALSGTGIAPTASLSPTTYTFPSTAAAATASTALTLSNTGTATLTFSGWSVSGTGASAYSGTTNCTAAIAAGKSCTYTLTFKPTAGGTFTETLSVATSQGTFSAAISGSSPLVRASVPKVTLISIANPSIPGRTVGLVTHVASSNSTPTGIVQLKEGATVLARITLAAGVANFRLPGMPAGTHTLTADYLGDKLHSASTSAPLHQVVGGKPTVELP